MNADQFQAKLIALSEAGTRNKIVGAIMAGDDRTPLASSAWRLVVLPILQGTPESSKLSTMAAGDHDRLLDAFKAWVAAVSKPGPGGPMTSDVKAIAAASKLFEALDPAVGAGKPPAAGRPKPTSRPTQKRKPKPGSRPTPPTAKA